LTFCFIPYQQCWAMKLCDHAKVRVSFFNA
jgi:hypothetical protein